MNISYLFYYLQSFLTPENGEALKKIYESNEPQNAVLPKFLEPYMKSNKLGLLCLLRTIRADKIIPAI